MAAIQKWRVEFAHRYGITPPTNAREQFMKHLRFADNRFWWVGPEDGFVVGGHRYDPIGVGSVMLSGGISRETTRRHHGQYAHRAKSKPITSGDKFGLWEVVRSVRKVADNGRSREAALCRCACGTERYVPIEYLRRKRYGSKSCGCVNQRIKKVFDHRTHTSWRAMHNRCYNLNHDGYWKYGAKGIRVCEQWHSFERFFSDMGKRPLGMTIDRIDPHGWYSPDNCRWATEKSQQRNKVNNTLVEYNGERLTLSELLDRSNISSRGDYASLYTKAYSRVRLGWPVDRVLAMAQNEKAQLGGTTKLGCADN